MPSPLAAAVARPRTLRALLLVAALLAAPLAAQAQLANFLVSTNQSRSINKALKAGNAVLIAEKTVFNPVMAMGEDPSVRGGDYRPPLTYWVNRGTGEPLVLGGYTSEEGRGKLLTANYHFFILEPGIYDLVGFVRKTRRVAIESLPRASSTIRSSLGFVNFSQTTLPALYQYRAWVPPQSTGSTFDGNTITQWYDPGYYADRVGVTDEDAVFVDMRGLIPHDSTGNGNIASFVIEAGQMMVISDFKLEFSHGACDTPAPGQRVCPIETLTLSLPFSPQQDDAVRSMGDVGYKAKLKEQVGTVLLIPGQFFAGKKMTLATDLRTTRGDPYAVFEAQSAAR